MPGALRKTMLYLGLADDRGEDEQEYVDDYDETGTGMADDYAQVTPLHRSATVRDTPVSAAAGDLRRITTVHPRTFNDAQVIGRAFRSGTPVIINLSDVEEPEAQRLVDFSSGLVFGLNGGFERVTSKVFLLSPENIEVTDGDREAAPAPRGFFNHG